MDKKKPGNIVGWDRDCVNASEEEGLVGKNCEVPVDDDDDDVGDIRWVEELWLKKRGEEVTGLKMVKQEIKITTSGTSDSRISETRSETIKDSSEKLEREMKPETSSMTEKVPADQEDAEVDGLTEVDAKVALQSYELTSGDAPEKQSKQLTPADAPGTENQDLTPDDTSAINQDPSPAAASEISQDPTPADAPDRRDKVVRSVITQRNCRIPPAYFGPAFDENYFQCVIRVSPVFYSDLIKDDFQAVFARADSIWMLRPKSSTSGVRVMEIYCQRSAPFLYNLMFCPYKASTVSMELVRKKPIGFKRVTRKGRVSTVPTAYSADQCSRGRQ